MVTPISQPPVPQGMARSGSGLIIPSQYAAGQLDPKNKELLDLRGKLDYQSLENSIIDAYITTVRKQDAKGVTRYDPKAAAGELANKVMEQLTYHVHNRHFETLPRELIDQAGRVTDQNGESYAQILVSALTGINKTSLLELLKENPLDLKSTTQIAGQIAGRYLQLQTSKKVQSLYGDDLPTMRKGLENLGQIFHLDPRVFKIKDIPRLGQQETLETYLKGVFNTWNIIDQEQ